MNDVMRTLSLIEAANFLGIHKETAHRLAACHKMPAAKIGRSWRFLEIDLSVISKSVRIK